MSILNYSQLGISLIISEFYNYYIDINIEVI